MLKHFARFAVVATVLSTAGCYYHDYDRDDNKQRRGLRWSPDWDDDRDHRKYDKRYRDDDRSRYYDNDRRRGRDDDDDDDDD
ncbi:hypothetical protein NPS58_16365 [Pseudomonas putida]|uniref:hypothetical protein n=1 Tax=Pseudomonas putida TaxID=303 RepID=UPI00236491A6|nr:hypothetical protein [Pseudomonas putida]MDD2059003.1 hypothetical protein [Pseudomonas putida]